MYAKRQYLGSMPDRISNLPDAILLHILSFLPIKDAVNTSVLSKKWDNLWAQLPNLNFGGCSINFINHVLILHQALKVNRFSIDMAYREKFMSNIYAWFHFAVKRHVEELRFTMCKNLMRAHDYPPELPLNVYRNACLKVLELACFCFYNMKSVSWPLLRSLSLKEIDNLSDEKLNIILSGSPLLEKLVILECHKLKFVNLSGRKVKSLCLGYLKACERNGEALKLCIPNVSLLSLCGELDFSEDYMFEDGSCTCLESVELGFELLIDSDDNHWSQKLVRDNDNNQLRKEFDEMPFKKLLRIVDDLSHVEVLAVKYHCLQMFSVLETINLSPSTSKRKCLTVETGLRKWELPGICHLLRSSPELEELTLKVRPSSFVYILEDFQKKHHFKKVGYLESQKATLQSLSQKLKIIKLHSIIGSEGNLEYNFVKRETNWLPKQFQKEMELVKFLLKHACVLEEIIIYINKKENIEKAKMRELLFNMFEDLFQFPRASPHAKVKFVS